MGRQFDPILLDPPRDLTTRDLDPIVPDRPVFILNASGHIAYVNSRTLELVGITRDSEDPPAGEYGPAAAETDLDFRGPIAVDAEVTKMGEEVLVRAVVRARVRLECARCLNVIDRALECEFQALYVPRPLAGEPDTMSSRVERDSGRIFYYDAGLIDLGDRVVEALLGEVPMKPLCRPDCRGICPRCGKDLNEGPCGCRAEDDFDRPFRRLLGGR
jgi:uncharacterized protein